MKSLIVAVAIAFVGSSVIADDASARSKRGGAAGAAGLAAMAPLAVAAGTALLASGYVVPGAPVYVDPVVVTPHLPVHVPMTLPAPFVMPGVSVPDIGG